MIKKAASKIYIFLVFLFLYAPIFVLIAYSFNASKSRSVWTGFTFDWYAKLINNDLILTSLLNTLVIALIASVLSTILGTLAALGIYKMKHFSRSMLVNLTYLPIINPEIVTGVSLMLLFVFLKIDLGYLTLVLAHVSFCVPYVILNVLPKLRQMNNSVYEAAMDLGCNKVQAFRHAVLPEIMPGVVTGFLMSITYSIDDFVISYFTHGATSQTLPITIFSMTRRKVSPEVNALSAIIFVVVLTVLLVMNIVDMKKYNTKRTRGKRGAER